MKRSLSVLIVLLFFPVLASAQFDFSSGKPDSADSAGGPKRGERLTQVWRAGIIIEPGTAMENVQITVPVPTDWYEQRVVSVSEEKMGADLADKIQYRRINNGALEMNVRIGNIKPVKTLEMVVAFEVENFALLPPEKTDQYVIPKRVPPEIRPYLRESPCIESDEPCFAKMFKEITKDRGTDWNKAEALYAFVQNNVKYDEDGFRHPAKGAFAVTKMPKGEWTGDCKDMSCLFVALCRAGKIPARIVRVPEHCYAEFYLELKSTPDGKQSKAAKEKPAGFWFPCQVSGTYSFGGIPEQRVILQKGDSFPDSEHPRNKTLFLKECFQGLLNAGAPRPVFKWIHETSVK
ncbi:MAG: transglutaminase-like domain-containing protein [Planctomycetaceae bacterium]|jgi:hypothetical protein|nr:transglutaminase-like domain-containing protein [Planctomycetaceae bacterium]